MIMSSFVWNEAMSVGMPALDADHRCLIRIINLLEDAEEGDVDRVVDIVMETLDLYCRYHFAREERIMRACGFPSLAFHRAEHQDFRRTVAAKGAGKECASAPELLEHLKAWLLHHILIQDMAYKPYVVKARNLDALSTGSESGLAAV
jgi:hemerythrin-like metal-binding protein